LFTLPGLELETLDSPASRYTDCASAANLLYVYSFCLSVSTVFLLAAIPTEPFWFLCLQVTQVTFCVDYPLLSCVIYAQPCHPLLTVYLNKVLLCLYADGEM
jgi:hypothetical protein